MKNLELIFIPRHVIDTLKVSKITLEDLDDMITKNKDTGYKDIDNLLRTHLAEYDIRDYFGCNLLLSQMLELVIKNSYLDYISHMYNTYPSEIKQFKNNFVLENSNKINNEPYLFKLTNNIIFVIVEKGILNIFDSQTIDDNGSNSLYYNDVGRQRLLSELFNFLYKNLKIDNMVTYSIISKRINS